MAEVTYSELLNFNAHLWESQADGWAGSADVLKSKSQALEQQARVVESAATGPAGKVAAKAILLQAESAMKSSIEYQKVSVTLTNGASTMDRLKENLSEIRDTAESVGVTVSDQGKCTANFTLNPIELYRRAVMRNEIAERIDFILKRATKIDAMITEALLTRTALPPVTNAETGPIDISIDAITSAGKNNAQGGWGDCTLLATLRALAETDPQLLQEKVKWDPDTQTYQVTLYDPETGKPTQVPVDPNHLVDASHDVKDPDKLTIFDIYEQALITQDPTFNGLHLDQGMRMVTGEDPTIVERGDFASKEISDALSADPPKAVTTAYSSQDPSKVPEDKRIVPNHAYHVAGKTPEGNIIVLNPWGNDGGSADGMHFPGKVELTPEEYNRWFSRTIIRD